jgi:diadenylate cyclase
MADTLTYLAELRNPRNLLDVALIALLVFGVLRLFQGTQAVQLVRGVLLITLVALVLSQTLDLTGFNWLLAIMSPVMLIALPVIFAPELRRALERVSRSAPMFLRRSDSPLSQRIVTEVARAVEEMSRRKIGALIVFEGVTGLAEITDRGVRLDAEVSAELILSIFFPNAPLHDGAAILRGERIVAAGCVLPLSQHDLGDPQLGTRHRAAVGVTEQGDAMSLVVSEESGSISIARNGRMVRVDGGQLRKVLTEFYRPTSVTGQAS